MIPLSLAVAAVLLARLCRLGRLEVTGLSMVPTLAPGDRVLVVRASASWRPSRVFGLRPGSIVVLRDPREPQRTMVKRVVRRDGQSVVVHGDNPGASTDSRTFGPVAVRQVRSRVVYRYHPARRRGPVL